MERQPPESTRLTFSIEVARLAHDIESARVLFLEYATSLGFSLCFQNFDEELATLPGEYAPPRGRLFLARVNGRDAGCVGLRPLSATVCEMKRLYVRTDFRGSGVGRRLAQAAIDAARDERYNRMRLDTVEPLMSAAVSLYRTLGFREIAPYTGNPQPGALYMELDLEK